MWDDEGLEEDEMDNIFYVYEYAQRLEQAQLIANLEEELDTYKSDDGSLGGKFSDEELGQIILALEHSMTLLFEKLATIQAQQRKVESQLDRLYVSEPLRERILKKRRIEEMNFPVRVYNFLKGANVSTLYDLCSKNPNEVLQIFGGNKWLFGEVEKKLNEKRLRLYGVDTEGDVDKVNDSTEKLQYELERKFDELFGSVDE